jgi:hypothetical protein
LQSNPVAVRKKEEEEEENEEGICSSTARGTSNVFYFSRGKSLVRKSTHHAAYLERNQFDRLIAHIAYIFQTEQASVVLNLWRLFAPESYAESKKYNCDMIARSKAFYTAADFIRNLRPWDPADFFTCPDTVPLFAKADDGAATVPSVDKVGATAAAVIRMLRKLPTLQRALLLEEEVYAPDSALLLPNRGWQNGTRLP